MKYSIEELLQEDGKYVIHGWGYNPVIIVEGKGAVVKDISGREYIDAISSTAGPMGIGHSHPKVVEAVKKQVEKLSHTFMGNVTVERVELAKKLTEITPPKFNKYYFTSGGSEAVETALKGAMKISKKKGVISLYLAYHGGTIATLSLGQPWHAEDYPLVPGFRQIPPPYCYRCFYGKSYPDCDLECARALERTIKYGTRNDVAAFIIEPVLGNGGHILPPDKEYFKIVRETCDDHDILLIVDEIQTGLGRTGKMWGCEYFDFQPDIMCIGKILGGGLPVGAAVFREDVVPENFGREVWHAFTFSGSPIQLAAASAVVDVVVEEKLPEKASEMGKFMTRQLKQIQERHEMMGEVRGPGLFIGVEFVKDRKTKEKATQEAVEVLRKSLEKGVFFGLSSKPGVGNLIKIKPPLNITEEQARKCLDVLDESISEIEA